MGSLEEGMKDAGVSRDGQGVQWVQHKKEHEAQKESGRADQNKLVKRPLALGAAAPRTGQVVATHHFLS